MQLIILAAGMSTRYGKLKQLDIIHNNKSIMDFSIEDAKKAGINDVILIVNPLNIDLFKEKYGDKVKYAIQDNKYINLNYDKPLGTSYALYVAKDLITEDFIVINADDYYGPNAFNICKDFFETNKSDYAVLAYQLKDVVSENGSVNRGIIEMDNEYYIKSVKETKNIEVKDNKYIDKDSNILDGECQTSMGFHLFKPDVFTYLDTYIKYHVENKTYLNKELYLTDFMMDIVSKGNKKIKILTTKDRWQGVTYITDKEIIKNYFEKLDN